MPRIVIIGCGWLGLPLAEALIESGFQVSGSTSRREKIPDLSLRNIHPFVYRMEDGISSSLQTELEQADYCFLNIPPGKIPQATYEDACLEIFKALSKQAQLIFVSSTGVYPDLNKEVTEEDAPIPDHPLVMTEHALKKQGDTRVTVLRPAGLFGGQRHPAYFLSGKSNLKHGKNPVNLVHLEDCIRFILLLIQHQLFGRTVNLCTDEHPERQEYYLQTCSLLQLPLPQFISEKGPWKTINNSLSKSLFGFHYEKKLRFP
ncbi:MAG: hypothetical protein EP338_00050 [Bacteroidetes bacterium]|nr:MAG: hypothetical protein EP338_00050 [Bacteroidota bacterium]